MDSYPRRLARKAFVGSLGGADLWSGFIGAALAVAAHYMPGQRPLMDALAWQVPLWALGAVGLVRVLAAPFLLAKEDGAKIRALESRLEAIGGEYHHALRLGAVDYNQGVEYDPKSHRRASKKVISRQMGFTLHLENTIGRPVRYEFDKIAINGFGSNNYTAPCETLSPHAKTQFRTHAIPVPSPIPTGNEHFLIELDYRYGRPGQLTRRVQKKLKLTINFALSKTSYGYEIDEETECP